MVPKAPSTPTFFLYNYFRFFRFYVFCASVVIAESDIKKECKNLKPKKSKKSCTCGWCLNDLFGCFAFALI